MEWKSEKEKGDEREREEILHLAKVSLDE